MIVDARQISEMLGSDARNVCFHLLPQGKKVGSQWQVGNLSGEKGKSLNIQLTGSKAGVWCDFATGDKGDMLALWMRVKGLSFSQAFEEACSFLGVSFNQIKKPSGNKKEYKKPEKKGYKKLSEKYIEYFKSRLINEDILDYLKIRQNEKDNICFPFFKNNELIGMKYFIPRSFNKENENIWFKEKDCEPCLWGWQGIGDNIDDVVITEGEIDAMTCYSVGFPSLSIPSGASDIESWIESEFDSLQRFKTIRLCLDSDAPGRDATDRIAVRLGLHRVLFVSLPEKDSNDTLVKHGKETLVKCINSAKPRDPDCIKKPSDYVDELFQLLDPDFQDRGSKLPFTISHDFFTFRPSELSLWTGWNGHGKTQLLNFVAVHGISKKEKWMIYSPEMRPRYMLKRLITQVCAKPLNDCDATEIKAALDFLDRGLFIYDSRNTEPVEKILEAFSYARRRYDVTNFVIDSLQKCGLPEGGDGELAAQKRFMDLICQFKDVNDCHLHLVAHPRKGKDDTISPNKLDIKGSGSISDLADNVLIVQRNKKKEGDPESHELRIQSDVFLEIAKQRNGEWEGTIDLWYRKQSYQYTDISTNPPIRYLYK